MMKHGSLKIMTFSVFAYIFCNIVKGRDWGPVTGLEKEGFGSCSQKTWGPGPGFGY